MSLVPSRLQPFILLTLVAAFGAACRGGDAAPAQGPPPPAAVRMITLEQKPVAESSEYIATLRSLRSTTVQPEVAGAVQRLFVAGGERVRAGAPLVQIDPDIKQAEVRSSQANRSGLEADVAYWRQQVKRLESLVGAGAISRQEFEQAQNQLTTAEARLAAQDAEVREKQVQLGYYRVTAPQDGIVGDITIRPGDRVTPATVITTIDQSGALEAYIEVPLESAPDLRTGLPVEILDRDGAVAATNPITFVAPRVDEGTQSVLVKAALKDLPPQLRVQQFVKARIVWRSEPGLTVPVVAVSRISGQYFVFVAEPQGQGFTARQRAIQVGDVVGDDYIVRGGLKPGERVIVTGIQKLGDGAPVTPEK